MAYAALNSLKLSSNQIMLYPVSKKNKFKLYPVSKKNKFKLYLVSKKNKFKLYLGLVHDERKQIQYLLPKLEYLLEFLENSSHRTDERTCSLITRIRVAAYEAQNIVDLYCYDTEMAIIRHVHKPENMDLQNIIREIDAIESDIRGQTGSRMQEAKNIYKMVPNDSTRLASKNMMVGFKDDFMAIMDKLKGYQSELEVVSIVGMGGIGKTTIAKNIYNDPLVMNRFDIRVWVVASRSSSIRNMLLCILDSMIMLSDGMRSVGEDELKERLYNTLKGRRYLIIIDDIWDVIVWHEMRMVLPNDNNGSRILLTTRLEEVAASVSSSGHIHHMRFLTPGESWSLLRDKVFGDEDCPLELQEIGQKISERWGGLPLSLVVMGGLLSRINKTKEAWLDFEKNVTSNYDLDSILEILKLSYDYLPQWLKPCFLYMGVFPKDEEIPVSKLIKLWVAEGFLKQAPHQNPEAVAEKCLKELVDRNMIFISKQNFEGKMKTCRIHGLLLDFCVSEADKEKFLFVSTPTYADTIQKTPHDHLRISIHLETPDLILSDSIPSFSYVRSLLYTGSHIFSSSHVFLKFKLLKVLDAIKVAFPNFPNEFLELLNLRYISFMCLQNIPASISNLRNLQTLIIHNQEHSANLPVEIWNMTHLRHVEFEESSLPDPIGTQLGIDGSPLVLTNLHTLSGVRNLRFTKEVLARIPSIQRLKISYDAPHEQEGWSYYEFQNLAGLPELRALKIYIYYSHNAPTMPRIRMSDLEFGSLFSIEKLTLGGFSSIYGCDLSDLSRLPNLVVLKLKSCHVDYWTQTKEKFERLKVLLLQGLNLKVWDIVYDHNPFPRLEQLIVRDCDNLTEIPHKMGLISTLHKIELDKYNKRALDSAERIQEKQHARGNHDFQVVLHTTKPTSFSHTKIARHASKIKEWNVPRLEYVGETKQQEAPGLAPTASSAAGSVSFHESSTILQGDPKIKEITAEPISESMGDVDSSSSAWNYKSSMVGFHEEFSQIKNWLTESKHDKQLEVMKIVGSVGMGKTTLARNLFEQAATDSYFDFHAWVSVSRTNSVQKIIRAILDSMRPKEYELDDKSIEKLTGILYKSLKGKRYLIVLDDVWDIQVWDDIKGSFPDDNMRSRIILTTRLTNMDLEVRFSDQNYPMKLLPPKMCWTLLHTKVFGKEKCPQELEDAVEDILQNCRRLPLAIVVIGGLLSKVSRTEHDWQLILETMNSTITSKEHLKGILSLGYKYLPLNLRACFRSMIISAEDYELSVPRLIRLWIDERLVNKTGSKSPEEVAEDFLKDLIDRSLIMVCKQNKKGEAEMCCIPSIWQDYFVANDPVILQILLSKSNQSITRKEGMKDLPRSYSEGVSMTVEEGQKEKINREQDLEISMDMLFNNIYTKDCIRYCSLFPTAFEFTKDILVSLWIAQGGTIAGNDAFIEEACIQCFDILLKVKYIVPTGYDPYGDQIKYIVGGEMNAFLQNHLIRPRFSKELDSKYVEKSKVEHLSLSFKEIGLINFEIIKKLSRLHTLIIHGCYGFKVKYLPFDLFKELKALRILSLSHTDVEELPSSIENSKALQYLDMSETPIRWLPESMWSLNNLQTLKLDNCLGLIRLPKRMKQLINLRHLILDISRQLQSMPEGIGKLSELRTLRAFLVGEEDGCSINELKCMNKLSGSLRILKLENIKTPDQATDASLCSKQDLKKIELQWSDFQDEKNSIEEKVLACLEPPLGIQELKIFYYSGGELPSWISKPSFSELFSITLHKCVYCTSLPALGQLPSLKFLSIVGMNEVLEINSLFCGEQGNQHQPSFPMLEKLSFDSMSKLEKWTKIRKGDFPRLMNLIIESCPKFNRLPSLSHMNSLMHMEISYCPELLCLPAGILPPTLESLMIKDCPKLEGRCSSNEGEDWPKIAHVPVFYIDNMKIQTK